MAQIPGRIDLFDQEINRLVTDLSGLKQVLSRLIQHEEKSPIIVVDASNLKWLFQSFDLVQMQQSFMKLIRLVWRCLQDATAPDARDSAKIVAIFDGVPDPQEDEKGMDFRKLKLIQQVEPQQEANRIMEDLKFGSFNSLLKKTVWIQALKACKARGANVQLFHAGSRRLQDADTVVGMYAKKTNAAMVWSRDNDFCFMEVTILRHIDLYGRVQVVRPQGIWQQLNVVRPDDIRRELDVRSSLHLHALGNRSGNDYFFSKDMKPQKRDQDMSFVRRAFTEYDPDVEDRYKEHIARYKRDVRTAFQRLKDQGVNFSAKMKDFVEQDLHKGGKESPRGYRRFVCRAFNLQGAIRGDIRQLKASSSWLSLYVNELSMVRQAHGIAPPTSDGDMRPFDPYDCDLLQEDEVFEDYLLQNMRETYSKQLGARFGPAAAERLLREFVGGCEVENRLFALLTGSRFWWPYNTYESPRGEDDE
eukprot:247774-Hanusia_phi.AAC.1